MPSNQKTDSFLRGALILTVAGVVVKIIGSVNRILLSRLLGGEGIGLYQMAYPLYLLALSISSAGIPVAISIVVAEKAAQEDWLGARRVFRISLYFLIVTGVLFSLTMAWGAQWLIQEEWVRDPRAYWSLAALAPAILFVTIISSYRGYFQGLQLMTPTAMSQIAEQVLRVFIMVALAYFLLPYGLEYAAAGASFGAVPGAVAAFLVLIYYDRKLKRRVWPQSSVLKQEHSWSIVKKLIRLALPVSAAHIMVPIVASIDLLIVPRQLEVAGFTTTEATELFGYLTGMAIALVNLPAIVTGALATGLVPAIAASKALRNLKAISMKFELSLRLSQILTVPSFVGLYLLAGPISQMLYGTPNAADCIAVLSVGIFFLGIHQVATGVLQGLGHTSLPVASLLIAALFKIILSFYLTAQPSLGILGAAWASVADFALAALINLWIVYRKVAYSFPWRNLVCVILSSALMAVSILLTYDQLMIWQDQNTLATLLVILQGSMVYVLALVLLGGLHRQDIEKIPKIGLTAVRLLSRLNLLK